jgi:hypothetical protein
MKERRITVPVIPTSDDDDDDDEDNENVAATTREPEDVTPATGVVTMGEEYESDEASSDDKDRSTIYVITTSISPY